jgi:hypothetical protein
MHHYRHNVEGIFVNHNTTDDETIPLLYEKKIMNNRLYLELKGLLEG